MATTEQKPLSTDSVYDENGTYSFTGKADICIAKASNYISISWITDCGQGHELVGEATSLTHEIDPYPCRWFEGSKEELADLIAEIKPISREEQRALRAAKAAMEKQ
ncbi:hypothetical protein [Methylobacter sp. YRD-M1]|uniref:hypothetical protein n=1 Tax=Methylobacter sp. YRD-M1 TaxID=2911520 RepID=UPI00227B8038|nr:hypothetical protein [Methylobacter sp. YRD-M1]WAK01846.1 hypothetical protein LZ558_18835 [Methylobacter sp. YRD-M1]